LAQILLTLDLDLDRVQHLSAAWRGRAVVARAVEDVWRALELPDEHPFALWAREYVAGPAEHRISASISAIVAATPARR
jgi:hypothetical protein